MKVGITPFYRIYAFGGIAALIGIPIGLALVLRESFPTENFIRAYMVFLTAWISGLLGYWWWVFLFKEEKALRLETASAAGAVPPISALKNLTTLHQAMALNGGDPEALVIASRSARRPVLEFYGWQNLLVFWILGMAWAGMLDLLPERLIWLLPVGVLLIIFLLVLRLTHQVSELGRGFRCSLFSAARPGSDQDAIPSRSNRLPC